MAILSVADIIYLEILQKKGKISKTVGITKTDRVEPFIGRG